MFDVCTTGDMAHINTIFKFLPHTRQHFDACDLFRSSRYSSYSTRSRC